jgi:hypothetical protein
VEFAAFAFAFLLLSLFEKSSKLLRRYAVDGDDLFFGESGAGDVLKESRDSCVLYNSRS